ncbi:hypothetical protein [Scandinavium hiltneri]|uniref:hypothetical protein n=1 Tax=Scandinavium hiltneri TaxID=2926519 RepID=UPI0035AF9CA5
MTNNKLTNERLSEIADKATWVKCSHDEVQAMAAGLQEYRKAAGDPVAWLLSGGGAKNVVCFDSGNAYADPLREVTPLYTTPQPAPAVEAVPFDQWISQQRDGIDVDCGCVTTEAFFHWIRVAYEAGNSPVRTTSSNI